jgi:hypothetical protein
LACWTRDNAPAKLEGHHEATLVAIRRPPRPRNINEKANSETDRGKMCGVRWDWNYAYGAASAAGPQNLPPCKQCGGKGRVKEAAN